MNGESEHFPVDPALQSVVEDLTEEYAGIFGVDTVARCVADSADALARDGGQPMYYQVFVCRFARDRLRATARTRGLLTSDLPEVLIACRQNAGRSVAGRLLLEHSAQGRVVVRSAGSEPGDDVHDQIRTALTERGLDVSKEFPKPLTDEMVQAADIIVTMGCGEACPVFPGKRYLDWLVEDPSDQDLDTVRRIVDDIDARVRGLLAELLPGQPLPDPPTHIHA
jgi:arsenate reductase